MFIITEETEDGLIDTKKTKSQRKAYEFMLKMTVEYCLQQFDITDFCENYVDNKNDENIEYFDSYDELRDAGLLNDYCDYLMEFCDCMIYDDYCYVPISKEGCYYRVIIQDINNIEEI